MRATRSVSLTAAGLGICLLGIPLLRLLWQRPQQAQRPPHTARVSPTRPATPSEAALREAKRRWNQAQMAIKPELEAMAEANPLAGTEAARWRQSLMARDAGGHLQQAQQAASRALAQAGTPEAKYEATLWLALIQCDRGRHAQELRQVRRLVDLRPGSTTSLGALRRAARCNGMWGLARQMDEALIVAEGSPDGDELPDWPTDHFREGFFPAAPTTRSPAPPR
jgi:hypothetical protein